MARIFAAIPIGEAAADALQPLLTGLDGARWTPQARLHLTLRFAGELAPEAVDRLRAALAEVRSAPVRIDLEGVGRFELGHGQGAVWAGVRPDPALLQLRQACEDAAQRAGLEPDDREWLPHVTLAYASHTPPAQIERWLQQHRNFHAGPAEASGFAMYESLRTGGAIEYRLVQSYGLGIWPSPRPAAPGAGRMHTSVHAILTQRFRS